MARLKVRRVVEGQDDQELEIDESELTENETVEERIEEADPIPVVEAPVVEEAVPTVEEAVDKLATDASEALQTLEGDLITLVHSVENGMLCIGARAYEIINYEVKVLESDYQDCISHGLYKKE